MKIFLIIASMLFLFSCQRYDSYANFAVVRSGFSPYEVALTLEKEPFMTEYFDNSHIQVYKRLIQMQTGYVYTYDLFLYENDSLIFWGTFDEFKTHPNPNYRQIGEKSLELVLERL